MLRRSHILTTAAVLALSAAPASAITYEDLHSPNAQDAVASGTDLRSPDARDAAREAAAAQPGTDLRSPDARDAAREAAAEPDFRTSYQPIPPKAAPEATVEVRQSSSEGFDWGAASIGAAGMLALLSIVAGSTLLVSGHRRRRFEVAH